MNILAEDPRHPVTAPELAGRVAQRVPGTLEQANAKVIEILRHQEDRAAPFRANLADKLSKGTSSAQIENGVGFAAVTITTGNRRKVQLSGKGKDGAVFAPGTHAIDF